MIVEIIFVLLLSSGLVILYILFKNYLQNRRNMQMLDDIEKNRREIIGGGKEIYDEYMGAKRAR